MTTLGRAGPWRHQDFRLLWAAQAVSVFGSRITRTAPPVVAILLVTTDPLELAILGTLDIVPGILVGLFAGGWIDRNAKRPVLIATDIARALLVFRIPLAAWFAELTLPQLCIVAALVGTFTALFRLPDNAYLPTLIDRDRLIEGNSKLEATDSVAEIGGPGLAGVLIQWLTAPFAMLLDALSYLWSAMLLTGIRAREDRPVCNGQRASFLEDMRIGLRAGIGHPIVGPTLKAIAVGEFCNGVFVAAYSLYALKTLAMSVAMLGLVVSLGGVSTRWRLRRRASLAATRIGRRVECRAVGVREACEFVRSSRESVPRDWCAHARRESAAFGRCARRVPYFGEQLSTSRAATRRAGTTNGMLQAMSGVLLTVGALVAGALASATSVSTAMWIGTLGGLLSVVPLLRPNVWRLQR